MVGVLGTHETGIARSEEDAAAGKGAALREQGFDERLRLGAGLAPDEAITWPDDAT